MSTSEIEGRARLAKRVPDALVAGIVVAVLAALVFVPSLFGPFLYDDKPLIVGNEAVRSFAHWRRWFTRDFWDVSPDLLNFANRIRYWRPLVTASYATDFAVGSGSPVVFHVTNLIAHGGVAVLAFLTLRRWIGRLLPAFFAALLFAVHPTKAESVAWISGRTDVLCLLAVLVAASGMAMRHAGRRPSGVTLEIVGTAVAYATKEGAIVLPAFAAVEAWAAAGRPSLDRRTIGAAIRASLPQLSVAVGYVAIRGFVMPLRPSTPPVALADHAKYVLETFGHYAVLTVAPHDLSTQRALLRTDEAGLVHQPAYVVLGAIALVGIVSAMIVCRRRAPAVTVGLALWLGTLVPVSNLVLMGMSTLVAERFLYLPSLGAALVFAHVVFALAERRRAAIALASALVLACAFASARRSFDFADEAAFWAHERSLHPEALEPRRFAIARAAEERRFRKALEMSIDAQAQAARWYRHTGAELELIHKVVELKARLTPDRDVEALAAYDRFFRDLLDPSVVELRVEGGGLRIALPLVGPMADRARSLRARSSFLRAEIASRLGRDDEARARASAARASCASCVELAIGSSFIEARAGRYGDALAILAEVARVRGEPAVAEARKTLSAAELAARQGAIAEGPMKLQLRAHELSLLEAWGRAYEVLAPYRAEIEKAPGFALGFGELAFRAGHADVAKAILGLTLPAEQHEATLAEWSDKMGWR